ncbi:MAG: ATP-binding cassette domain-containing protein, partial [Oscillospiraceae bacterium]|nr:ATP-binding cassette domain-containing protein [Oscillospiraceae bacterium]
MNITDKRADMRFVRQKVGLVFQYPEHQLFEETVYKDIAFGPRNMGLDKKEIHERTVRAANAVGIDEKYFDRSPFDLSGGEQRRAAIAGVLAMEPEVLILDEPTAGLDPGGREGILNIIRNLHEARREMIIIFVSHSMEDVAKTAERVIVMNKGGIDMEGTVEEIFSRSERLCEIGLEVPQITRIVGRLNSLGYDIPKNIYTVEDAADAIKKLIGE